MNKIFAAVMTAMVVATVIAVFALGFLSLVGGPVAPNIEESGATSSPEQSGDDPS